MRKGFLGSLAVVALGAGLAFGQPYGPPAGPGGGSPYPMPDPGVVPGPPSMSGPSVTGAYNYTSPDGHPIIMPPGLDGMIPPGSMGAGAPGGAYPPDAHFGSGNGILQTFGGHHVWGGVDYLWWTPKSHQVRDPLVTTSAAADFGVLQNDAAEVCDQLGIAPDEPDDRRAQGQSLRGSSGFEAGTRQLPHLAGDVGADRGFKGQLAFEMVLHQAGRDAGRPGDLANRGGGRPLFTEQLERGIADPRMRSQVGRLLFQYSQRMNPPLFENTFV